MSTPPQDAHDAFVRLTPLLMEVSEAIRQLPARERLELANMIVGYFVSEAGTSRRGDLRIVRTADNDADMEPPC